MKAIGLIVAVSTALVSSLALAEPIRIVSWNLGVATSEKLGDRLPEIRQMSDQLDPDVLVLIEVAGNVETKMIAEALGWPEYYGVTSNWGRHPTNAYYALEAAVISKHPITAVEEFDTTTDGRPHRVFSHQGDLEAPLVAETRFVPGDAPVYGNPVANRSRGTMRVDLENGLTIFPVHLKSNNAYTCSDLEDAIGYFEDAGLAVPQQARDFLRDGFPAATTERVNNAIKREAVMAATVQLADQARAAGRTVLIAGDFNTSMEPQLHGEEPEDCVLQNFTCEQGQLPAGACTGASDGYDDTLSILTKGLGGGDPWSLLTKGFGRTYKKPVFYPAAIDHMAVSADQAGKFAMQSLGREFYGSDHLPLLVVFNP